jgi:hypothetical protein
MRILRLFGKNLLISGLILAGFGIFGLIAVLIFKVLGIVLGIWGIPIAMALLIAILATLSDITMGR